MTRLLTCGYETGDVTEAGVNTVAANMAVTVVNSTPTPRAGAYCLKIGSTTGNDLTFPTHKAFGLPVAKSETWVRFAIYLHAGGSTRIQIAQWRDVGGLNTHCNLNWLPTDGLLRLNTGIVTTSPFAVSSAPLPADSWHVVEWRLLITSASAGVSELWLDGNQVINFSGDVTSEVTLTMQSLLLGVMTTATSSGVGSYIAFDDIAINDVAGSINNGRPGDGRVVLLLPNGAGSSTQFARGGTDTGANWSQVSELPPSMTQYVSSATIAQRDLYTLSNLGVAVSAINVVEAVSLTQNSDAGGGSIAHTLKSGATTNEATAIGLATTPGFVTSRWETDPNTPGTAWTAAAVDALEAGATIR